jgi:hypothetical protein
MVNVILSSDNVTVLGGPSRLDVDLNIGATGVRGSLIFNGFGNPNFLSLSVDFPTAPRVFDIFIDADPSSDSYLQAYQFVNQDGATSWIPVFKLQQDVFSINKVITFSEGYAETIVNITELGLENIPFDVYENSFSYFNISATISNIDVEQINSDPGLQATPAAISAWVGDAFDSSQGSTSPSEFPLFLPIKFSGVEFDGTDWVAIDDKKVIAYLTISFANPTEIFVNLEGEE